MQGLPEPFRHDESRPPAVEPRFEFEPYGCESSVDLSASSLAERVEVGAVEHGVRGRGHTEFQHETNVGTGRLATIVREHRFLAVFGILDESFFAACCHGRNE